MKIDLTTEMFWKFGSDSASMNIVVNGTTHSMSNKFGSVNIISRSDLLGNGLGK